MKILYVNVIELNEGWGAECFINRGFNRIGVETITLDYRKHRFNLAEKLLKIGDFDALLLQRGDYFPMDLLKCVNRPKFFWASELVTRNRDQDRLLKSGVFNHIFVHSKECKRIIVNEKKWVSSENVSILINGFDEHVQYIDKECKKDIDITFIGNILPRRRLILDNLKKNFNIYECQAYGENMTKVFNRSKIVINIHAENYLDTETRIFEALGCGAFVITEKLSSESPFINNAHLVEVDNIEDLKDRIQYYLSNESERKIIAQNGYEEVMKKHRYINRASEIKNIIEERTFALDHNLPAINTKKVMRYRYKQPFINLSYKITEFTNELR